MLNVALVGVGGQGSVLASKLLAWMAHDAGFAVRTAETIGMAQRGGSVVSHVRIGERAAEGAALCDVAPLIPPASASVMIAFEPGEALRSLELLAVDGTVLTATTALAPAGCAIGDYESGRILEELGRRAPGLIVVDDEALTREIGNRRCLNTMLLAAAVVAELLPFSVEDLRRAVTTAVKPRFEALNQQAITIVAGA